MRHDAEPTDSLLDVLGGLAAQLEGEWWSVGRRPPPCAAPRKSCLVDEHGAYAGALAMVSAIAVGEDV
jgi:hypothetical protein